MSKVFISYRRGDAPGEAGRLYDRLRSEFGLRAVFRDLDSLKIGKDFVVEVEKTIALCDAILVVIGQQWLTSTNEAGERRLDDPDDYLRKEVELALEWGELRILPVLVEGASMPSSKDLPRSIATLTRINALELTEKHWNYDFDQLIGAIREAGKDRPRQTVGRFRPWLRHAAATRRLRWTALVVLLALGAVAALMTTLSSDDPRFSTIRVGRSPVADITWDSHAHVIWAANEEEGTIARIDPRSNHVDPPIGAGEQPYLIAANAGKVWVAGRRNQTVSCIDAQRESVRRDQIQLKNRQPYGLASGAGSLWVAIPGSDTVWRIGGNCKSVTTKFRLGDEHITGARDVTIGFGAGWVASDGYVVRLDDGETHFRKDPVRGGPSAVTVDEHYVWAVSENGEVTRIDPANRTTDNIPVGGNLIDVSAGNGAVWVLDGVGKTVTRLNPRTGRPEAKPVRLPGQPEHLAVGRRAVWVSDSSAPRVFRIDF